jgi:hypothetical protein
MGGVWGVIGENGRRKRLPFCFLWGYGIIPPSYEPFYEIFMGDGTGKER